MRREEFMKELAYLLRDIPVNEREDALAYYENYFDEAGVENEYKVIQKLGSPASVAEKILADTQQTHRTQSYHNPESEKKQGMTKGTKILIAVIIILTFPLWIGIVAGLFGALVGIIGAAFGIAVGLLGATVGLVVGGIGLIVGGIMQVALYPAVGLACIGAGAVLGAIGLLLVVLCTWCLGVWLPKGIKKIVQWIKDLVHRKEGGDEI
ncbi:MAG: DUF1700 domain-containing protein [Agathobacter sp.]|nr:DUF1700 domain-containing protein [Agathobacter sp.]